MNTGVGIGLVVIFCSAIAIGFMIAIDRCFGNRKSDGDETKGSRPNIGDVEVIEADGYYAVRQFAWYDYDYDGTDRLDRISYFKTYYRYGPDWESSSSKWLYVDQNRFVSVDPEPVTLDSPGAWQRNFVPGLVTIAVDANISIRWIRNASEQLMHLETGR